MGSFAFERRVWAKNWAHRYISHSFHAQKGVLQHPSKHIYSHTQKATFVFCSGNPTFRFHLRSHLIHKIDITSKRLLYCWSRSVGRSDGHRSLSCFLSLWGGENGKADADPFEEARTSVHISAHVVATHSHRHRCPLNYLPNVYASGARSVCLRSRTCVFACVVCITMMLLLRHQRWVSRRSTSRPRSGAVYMCKWTYEKPFAVIVVVVVVATAVVVHPHTRLPPPSPWWCAPFVVRMFTIATFCSCQRAEL